MGSIRDRRLPVKSRTERCLRPGQGTPLQPFAARLSFSPYGVLRQPPLGCPAPDAVAINASFRISFLADASADEVSLHAFHSGSQSVRHKHHSHDSPALRAVGKPIGSCRGCLTRSYFDHDTEKCGISGASRNGPGDDAVDRGSDRRCIRRCARLDSSDESADILHLCLCWTECGGFPVRLSQSAALNVAEPSAPIRQRGIDEFVAIASPSHVNFPTSPFPLIS